MGRRQAHSLFAVICLVSLQLFGCGTSAKREIGRERPSVRKKGKVRAEAWLFDAQLRRKGKPTSFRLEIFRQDSLTALSGRGYLGKGGMKGLLSDDSVMIYFPISNEFVWESASTLLSKDGCAEGTAEFKLRQLLHNLPDDVLPTSVFEVKPIFREKKAQAFEITRVGCFWSLELHYDLTKVGWRLKRFVFDDGETTRVKADRRKFKPRAKVPLKRFQLVIPPDAYQLQY